jgi:hypothetical protein
MELAIFNTDKSLMPPENELKLLWSSVLTAERIYYHGALVPFAFLTEFFDTTKIDDANVEIALMFYPLLYSSLNVDVDKFIKAARDLYDVIKQGRRTRGKTKKYLLATLNAERTMKEIFENVSTYLREFRKNTTLEYLVPYFGMDDECVIKCYTDVSISFNKHTQKYFKDVSDLFFTQNKFLLADECIEKFQYENNQPEFLSAEVIDIPGYDFLNENQYMQFRDSFIPNTKDMSEVFRSLKENLKDTDFSVESITHFLDALKNNLDSYREDFQSKLYENVSMYTDIPASAKKHKLYAGITSVEKLISIYNKAKLFGDEFYAYLHEYLSQDHELNKLIPFFYLKITK